MARCSSPTDRTPRPRSTWAVFGYWKPPIWTRHWHGRRRVPSPAMRWARCASFFSSRTRTEQRSGSDNTAGDAGLTGPASRCRKVAKRENKPQPSLKGDFAMRFMVITKTTPEAEKEGALPDPKLLLEMGKY